MFRTDQCNSSFHPFSEKNLHLVAEIVAVSKRGSRREAELRMRHYIRYTAGQEKRTRLPFWIFFPHQTITHDSLTFSGNRRLQAAADSRRWDERPAWIYRSEEAVSFASLIYFHTCEVAYKPLRPQGQFQVQFPGWPRAAACGTRRRVQ